MWYVYILKCADEMLYTGITNNLERRIQEHAHDNKLGSKFVRVRRPIKLVYTEEVQTKSQALRRELEIKGWSRKKKLKLITGAVLSE